MKNKISDKIVIEKEKYLELMDKTEKELNYRYDVCDTSGHRIPNPEDNECRFCLRRLQYAELEPDRNFGTREIHRFENGDEKEYHIKKQKEEDRQRGLDFIYTGYETQEKIKECARGLVGKLRFWN
jgi:hypothetical protein